MSFSKKTLIICFAGCDWWYHNRGLFCTQVMSRMARRHYKVLFVNSLGMRIPSLRKEKNALKKIMRKISSVARYIRSVGSSMYIFTPLSIPLKHRSAMAKFNTLIITFQLKFIMWTMGFNCSIVWIGCPPAFEVVQKMRYSYLIYQCTDLFAEMPGINKSYILSLDRQLKKTADLVLYVNRKLWEEGRQINHNSILLGHGVDIDIFFKARHSSFIPKGMRKITKPIIGFFGDISEKTSDLKLLQYTIQRLPDYSFVFIGSISTNINHLKKLKNANFLGRKSHDDIPLYGKEFDVAIMPWNQNKWIEYCNPVKLKEYLALGKPIVSMYYPEVEPYSDVIYVARDYDGFVSCIRKAVAEDDPAKVQQRREKVKNETWDAKVEQIRAAILKRIAAREMYERRPRDASERKVSVVTIGL